MTSATPPLRVAVVGAGAIGCWVGGHLASSAAVTLVGRPGAVDAIAASGLTIGESGGGTTTVPADRVALATEPDAVRGADVVLVAVKSRDTVSTAASLAPHLAPGAVVVSLQNGLDNVDRLRAALPGRTVLAAMVGFNVVSPQPATYLRATSGHLVLERSPAAAPLVAAAAAAGLEVVERADMPAVQRAKLLLNLNNAVNALSGLPLASELRDPDLRRVLAACQAEALRALAADGPAPARLTPVPPGAMVRILRLPTPLFAALARSVLTVHPDARSSMADDLRLGRPTEVDDLQGAVVSLGSAHGVPTPVCARVLELVHEAESTRAATGATPAWTGPALRAAVGA